MSRKDFIESFPLTIEALYNKGNDTLKAIVSNKDYSQELLKDMIERLHNAAKI